MNTPKLTKRAQANLKLKELCTISQAVEKTGVPMRTIYHQIERGKIEPIVFGSRWLLDAATIKKLKARRQKIETAKGRQK